MQQKPRIKALLPDGRHLVKVVSVQEAEQIKIMFANAQGYTSLWLDLDDFACDVLYGILHCSGKPKQVYTNAERLKQDLIGCKVKIDILNNQVQAVIKPERILQSY